MTQETPAASTESTNSLLVWIVPLLALLVGGYMVLKEVTGQGPQITIAFDDGAGLEAGKTVLQHKGVNVGLVESVKLTPELDRVEATVSLQKSAKGLAREGSKFWILRPAIGIEGISGLGTLISGPTIQVSPGVGPLQKKFIAERRPPLKGSELGYHYYLRVAQLGSLKPGSPVLYRQFKVGEVVDTELVADATAVRVKILVNSPYDKLVRSDSVFWNASGIAMKVGLLGAKIQTDSLQSVLAGGIMFATPENKGELAALAPENTEFPLHPELDEDWLKWSPSIALE
ncbi:MlaD family protein [Pelagicoccus sp. SDUM812005]|uniref:PqiB family protein n=1 Tax=Pelagicoccus sp. SDUM812005 TaxID=3041257 RepID=UPI00280E1D16|nr:MlaD family protein [Pelagicoccus sp. SDUM812005]MDQ8182427.1 MlaD family protein [Pelagicoccus sp. SDUM812005]